MNISIRAALVGVVATTCANAFAANGDVDTSFGDNGIARTGLTDVYGGSNGCRPAVQHDGKIVICGTRSANGSSGADFFVARFNADGTPDTSFSFDGITTIDFDGGTGGTNGDSAYGVAVQSDGRIVVIGTTEDASHNANFAIARLTTDGDLDTEFGAGTGKTTVAFDLNAGVGSDIAAGVALQSDGKIVVVGTAETATHTQVAVTRLLADGSRDSAFNLNGRLAFSFAVPGVTNEADTGTSVAIDDNGRIVVAAQISYFDGSQTQQVLGVARLLGNGQFDANFHANGRSTLSYDPGSGVSVITPTQLIVQRSGRIAVTGAANSSASTTQNPDMIAARFLPDGTPDASFGIGGLVLIAFDLTANGTDLAVGLAEQSNGRLILAGTSLGSTVQYGTAARLTASGALDESFGTLGKATYDFALTTPDGLAFTGVAFQGTRIVAAGVGYVPPGGDTSHIDALVTRLSDDTIFADGFE